MTINKELEAKILRYHFVEHWGVHTIASQLGVHHSVVNRVLSQAGLPRPDRIQRSSIVDPYVPFIISTLKTFPHLTATRLYHMAQSRGFSGGASHFRARVAELRPRPAAEAFLRLKTLPGEQGQLDWAHFHYITIGKAKRPLMAFVMVLSWSRDIFLQFYLNHRMESFIRGHVAAFEFWGGLPKVILYDNLKSAVLERQGDAIRFHPTLLDLSAHYHFEARPVAVARGNEKGRVERSIRYIRSSFFAGRQWTDIDDLNSQAKEWCLTQSKNRPCPEDNSMTVGAAFQLEQPKLIALPDNPFPTDERIAVSVGKTPYIRYDLNDYSVPHTYVKKIVTVLASHTTVRILDGAVEIARHPRSYGKAEQIENPAHIDALKKYKQQARHHQGQDRLAHAAPSSQELLEQVALQGNQLKTSILQLIDMLDKYGAVELEVAIAEALQQKVSHPSAVRQVLERRREHRDQPPPIAIAFNNNKAKNIVVRPATLATYDELNSISASSGMSSPIETEDNPTKSFTPEDADDNTE